MNKLIFLFTVVFLTHSGYSLTGPKALGRAIEMFVTVKIVDEFGYPVYNLNVKKVILSNYSYSVKEYFSEKNEVSLGNFNIGSFYSYAVVRKPGYKDLVVLNDFCPPMSKKNRYGIVKQDGNKVYYIYNNGNIYVGKFKNGQKINGIYLFKNKKAIYKGSFDNDKFYTGILFKRGKFYLYNKGEKIGVIDHDGIIKNGSSIVGIIYKKNKYTGKTIVYARGGTKLFDGYIENGLYKSGTRYYYSDGYTFKGTFTIVKDKNGDYATEDYGELYDDKGKLVYRGKFKDREFSNGTYYYDNGYYTGDFSDGQRNGYGTYYWNDGSKYVGYWKNGNMNGYGTIYNKNGRWVVKGTWQDDKCINCTKNATYSSADMSGLAALAAAVLIGGKVIQAVGSAISSSSSSSSSSYSSSSSSSNRRKVDGWNWFGAWDDMSKDTRSFVIHSSGEDYSGIVSYDEDDDSYYIFVSMYKGKKATFRYIPDEHEVYYPGIKDLGTAYNPQRASEIAVEYFINYMWK